MHKTLLIVPAVLAACASAPESSPAWFAGSTGSRVTVDGREMKVVPYAQGNRFAVGLAGVAIVGNPLEYRQAGVKAVETVTGCEAKDYAVNANTGLIDVAVDC